MPGAMAAYTTAFLPTEIPPSSSFASFTVIWDEVFPSTAARPEARLVRSIVKSPVQARGAAIPSTFCLNMMDWSLSELATSSSLLPNVTSAFRKDTRGLNMNP